jgi:hypothetical protein
LDGLGEPAVRQVPWTDFAIHCNQLKFAARACRYEQVMAARRRPFALAEGVCDLEKSLPRPLETEIVDERGHWARVQLTAYLGDARWRATCEDGQEIVVLASQICTLARGRAA